MKLIVSDFDGTLFDENIENNVLNVKKIIDNDNIFALATGRTFASIKKMIDTYNISYNYLICSDGMCIYDSRDNVIYERELDKDFIRKIVDFCLNINKNLLIKYDDNKDISDSNTKASRILISADMEVKKQLCDALNNSFDDVYAYISTNWLNICDINGDKTLAIKYLQNLCNITNIYVIGNDVNDYAMVKYFNGYLIGQNINSYDEFIKKLED